MKTEWNYTNLADAYLLRPNYSADAIDQLLKLVGLGPGASVCDVGAGVAHLTLELANRGLQVCAVEPNDAMRANGVKRTHHLPNVSWHEGIGEDTGQEAGAFSLVTFGSSFNVCNRSAALVETSRILAPTGWFACMWNHRELNDPTQAEIEAAIRARVPEYAYGTRREDQTTIIDESQLFGKVQRVEGVVYHSQTVEDCLEAWRSHATLERQAGSQFARVIEDIAEVLKRRGGATLEIPYTTRVWVAQKRA
ncbi:MAG: hypothetical protein RJA70_74 [Pseudomonadota bacterium]